MRQRNIPVQVIAHCDADGAIRPLRFRFEDDGHAVHTVRIDEVADCRHVEYLGIETFVFLCKASGDGAERMFELRYTVRTHRWVLFREVY